MQRILVSGTAGYIGFHLARTLLAEGYVVHGYDGLTDYYDVNLKKERHRVLSENLNFSTQATVVSIEAIKDKGSWLAMTDNGRNHTGRDVIAWAKEAEERGAGEIIITSIDRDGLGKGYDLDLVRLVTEQVTIPVVSGGGFGQSSHLTDLIAQTQASAASVAQALHWNKLDMADLRATLAADNCFVRGLG